MMLPRLMLQPSSSSTRLRLTLNEARNEARNENRVRGRLPPPWHPRAAHTLLTGLSLWLGQPLSVVLYKRDGFSIKNVTEDPATGVRRVSVERTGVHPKTGAQVRGVVEKTIYPRALTPAEIDASHTPAFERTWPNVDAGSY